MSIFQLNLGLFVQGKFEPQAVNIAFVFQVNCPDCFIYGFPTMNRLYQQLKNKGKFSIYLNFGHGELGEDTEIHRELPKMNFVSSVSPLCALCPF